MDKKPSRSLIPTQSNILRELVLRIKLILRLMGDQRINPLLKLLPLASLFYLFWPLDLAPGVALPIIGAVDDAAIIWLGAYLFVELCPSDVVKEHVQKLLMNNDILDSSRNEDEEVIDAEAFEVDE